VSAIVASAPGKLFLLGEYAVLDGAPALLTAVDRRVTVTIQELDAGPWRLSAPDLGVNSLVLGDDGAVPAGLDEGTRRRLGLFDAVRTAVAERARQHPDAGRPHALSITTDSSALFSGRHKLGLGSSAAVAAALTGALARVSGLRLDREALCSLATSAHRTAQHGAGSGADVAASVYGGLLTFDHGASPTALVWPSGLDVMVVVTGAGSSTTELVGRVEQYAARDASGYRSDIDRLTGLANQAEASLDDAGRFLHLAADYFDALGQLDAHAHAGIVTERHLRLHEVAERAGGVFKTSGAGGGDVGLAFSRSGAPALQLAAALAAAGADVVPLGFGAAGLEDGS
jgi:phosphomevalonate kinase